MSASARPAELMNGATFRRAAALAGLLDSLASLGYLLLGSPRPMQILALLGKLVILLSISQRSRVSALTWGFVAACTAMAATSMVLEFGTPQFNARNYIVYAAVLVNLVMTVVIVNRACLRPYLFGFCIPGITVASAHLLQIANGAASSRLGRYNYVSGTHPNLGGEIAIATSLAAAISLRSRWFYPFNAVLAVQCYLLQARSALIVVASLFVIRAAFEERHARSRSVGLMVIGTCLAVGTMQGFGGFFSRNVLRVDDPYRGTQSRAGRAAVWREALDAFFASPIVGNGVGHPFRNASGAHNALLSGLALHGVTSLLLWTVVIIGGFRLWRGDRYISICLIPLIVPIAFNERFVNLNPYPYVILAIVLIAGGGGRILNEQTLIPERHEPSRRSVTNSSATP